ncbi:MAG: sugar O-acetyltransferase [Lactobacillus sp.]|uniref:DapH/DapD/GlmU-related protein n=1 Tax=Limosilactobacillus coleohominis TaxID=181675 RepID=UPI002A91A028|nr:DapH/DapD/GlmU-related protein [Limosilactobacillus coleohominis]MCI5812907.1 sugar O-acetyltransferase [Lactobacillus sp.]MDY5628555.1 DapH/DapD/GlmU-related protein [Limosilactobacillus coleohominis]
MMAPSKGNITDAALRNNIKLQSLNSSVASQKEIREQLGRIIQQEIDSTVEVRLPFYTDYGYNIRLGKSVFINSNLMMVDLGGITIDDHVLLGPHATIVTVNHPLDPVKRRDVELKPVHIKQNAWLGANTTILPGVTVGKNAVVAAGAVVSHDVPDNTVVAGVPAKVIKYIEAKEEN